METNNQENIIHYSQEISKKISYYLQKWSNSFLKKYPEIQEEDFALLLRFSNATHLKRILKGKRSPTIELITHLWQLSQAPWWEYLACAHLTMSLSLQNNNNKIYIKEPFNDIYFEEISQKIKDKIIHIHNINLYKNFIFLTKHLKNTQKLLKTSSIKPLSFNIFLASHKNKILHLKISTLFKIAQIIERYDLNHTPTHSICLQLVSQTYKSTVPPSKNHEERAYLQKIQSFIKKPNIYSYLSFSSFLRDYYLHKKSQSPRFSWRYISQKSQVVSPSLLVMIAEGDRLAKPDIIQHLAPIFNWNQEEIEYATLLALNDSEENALTRITLAQISSQKRTEHSIEQTEKWAEGFLQFPLACLLMEMVQLNEFTDDPQWIFQHLKHKVPLEEIANTLEWLKKEELIKIQQGKIVRFAEKFKIHHKNSQIHSSLALLLLESLCTQLFKSDDLDDSFIGCSLSLKEEDIPFIQEEIKKFIDEIPHITSSKEKDTLYQVSIQFTPFLEK